MTNTADLSLADSRYGQNVLTHLSGINETIATLLSHRSVRSFLKKPLPPHTLETLLVAAQSASSSCNLQMWSIVAVEEASRIARLADFAGDQEHIKDAPLFLVFLVDMSILNDTAREQNAPLNGIDYFDTFLVAALDAGLAAQNAFIAAESMGLGAVYAGSIRNRPEDVIKELKLPPLVFPLVGISVGCPDPGRPTRVKPRLPPHAVLHREEYTTRTRAEAVASYDEIMLGFYSGYRDDGVSWSQHALQRLRGPETLSGKATLKESVRKQGILLK